MALEFKACIVDYEKPLILLWPTKEKIWRSKDFLNLNFV